MSIFNPNDRGSTQNKGAGGGGNAVKGTIQAINAIFRRRSLFYNEGLNDNITPIVDSSLYYPLIPQLKRTVTTGTGVSTLITFKPDSDKHWMVFFADVNVDSVLQDLVIAGGLRINNNGNLTIQMVRHFITGITLNSATEGFPIIGSKMSYVNDTIGADPIQLKYEGTKSVYVSSNMSLIIQGSGSVSAPQLEASIAYLELPDNQPFGPTITL